MLEALSIPLPPLPEQKRIAKILGDLDDKIELNRQMNATLEAMARALFQSWFVDFDPVIDNALAAGKDIPDEFAVRAERRRSSVPSSFSIQPSSFHHLFPSEFIESELGLIPKGWEVRKLKDLTAYLGRGIGPSYIEKGGICVLNQKCIRDHRIDLSKSRRHDADKKSIVGRELQPFDILVNSTGTGTLGRVSQIYRLNEEMIVDSHVTIVRANSITDKIFLGVNLIGREAEIEEFAEGSTGQTELSRTRLGDLKVVTPLGDIQDRFGASLGPLLLRITENEEQSGILNKMRDDLLPNLLKSKEL